MNPIPFPVCSVVIADAECHVWVVDITTTLEQVTAHWFNADADCSPATTMVVEITERPRFGVGPGEWALTVFLLQLTIVGFTGEVTFAEAGAVDADDFARVMRLFTFDPRPKETPTHENEAHPG